MADTDYGTAELNTVGPHELSPALFAGSYVAAVLGTNTDQIKDKGLLWDTLAFQGHALTFGATRSGKGVSSIIPALLTYAGSMVCIDPKGENAWVTAERRRQLGQRVVILDPWGEVNRRYAGGQPVETVTSFNPLAALDPTSLDFGDEVAALADALITNTGSDPHWADSAREMIAGLVAAYIEARPGRAVLRDVRRALLLSQDDFGKLITFFEETNPDGLGCRKLAGYKTSSREVDSIRSTAKTQTAFLDSEQLCDGLEGEAAPFDLAQLATGRVTLYLVLPLDRLQTHGKWLRLILTLAIRTIARQAEPPAAPVLFLLDEFGTIGKLAMIEQAFGLMAGIGIRVWAFLQDLNQLKRDYPESWETFVANCAVMQVLNARDSTTSNYFSDYIGTTTMVKMSAHDVNMEKKYTKSGFISVNRRETGRPVMFAEEIRRLGHNQQLVFMVGVAAVLQQRVTYYGTPEFAGLYRPLPAFRNRKPRPITTQEAVAILEHAGFKVTAPGLRSHGWKIRWHNEPEKTYPGDAEFRAFAQQIRDEKRTP